MCPFLNISPLERLFVSQSAPHTQPAAKVRWFSLKMLRCRARALSSLYGYALVGRFYSVTCTRMRSIIHGVIGAFLRRRLELVRLIVLLIMPLSKVCPQCQLLYHQGNLCKATSKTEVPLHYCAEGLALQCFLVLEIIFFFCCALL